MTTEVRRAVALSISAQLDRLGRTAEWLAEETRTDASVLHEKLAMRQDFTVTDLGDIATALGIRPADLLPPVDPSPRQAPA